VNPWDFYVRARLPVVYKEKSRKLGLKAIADNSFLAVDERLCALRFDAVWGPAFGDTFFLTWMAVDDSDDEGGHHDERGFCRALVGRFASERCWNSFFKKSYYHCSSP